MIAGGGMIPWGGGDCPVLADTVVEVTLRSGQRVTAGPAEEFAWYHNGENSDIVSYRVIDSQAHPPVATDAAPAPRALDVQEGGDHYKGMAIQPFEYIHKNGIGFAEGGVIKYVSRWRIKGGIGDLRKARHLLDLLIEAEETP